MRYLKTRRLHTSAVALSPLLLFGCSDTAFFSTGTSIGIAASANTQQAQIGYARAELFQGPNYPDAGDVPQVVGFLGSDLAVFSPHIRQLYATGEAARLVTAPGTLPPCPADGKTAPDGQPNLCVEQAGTLNGERRILIFGTGTSVGLKLGFTGDAPSSINFGYDREELSVIPLHRQAPADDRQKPDKYSSVLASIDLNLKTPSLLGTDLKLAQFFATGAAARNLAKSGAIRGYFSHVAETAVTTATFSTDASSKTLATGLQGSKHATCEAAVRKWMQDNNITDSVTLFTYGNTYDKQRAQAIQDPTVKAACAS
jgi:hypothetical protein